MVASLLLVTFFAAAPSIPPATSVASGDVATELHRINESLQALVRASAAQAERTRLDLMLRRAELSAQELAPLTAAQQAVRQNLESAEEQLRSDAARLKQAEEAAADPQLPENEARQVQEAVRQFREQIDFGQRRVKGLNERLSALEGETAAKTADVEQIKTAIDRALLAAP